MKKIILTIGVAAAVAAFFYFDLLKYANLDTVREVQASAGAYIQNNPVAASAIYFVAYVLVTGLSLPGAAIMTLAGGALFGLVWGLVLVSFASSVGATSAFLLSRTLLRDWVQSKFGQHLATINEGIEREGAFYLFGMRMVPLFPFFLVNLVMGLTPMKAKTFYLTSQAGMLAGTAVFVFAGTQLAKINSLSDIANPKLLMAFALLGLFPFAAKKLMSYIQTRRESNESI